MTLKIILTDAYDKALRDIEDYIFGHTSDIGSLQSFWQTHDESLHFIWENPQTAAIHPATGDQSWPFGNGRYRVFFKHVPTQKIIYMIHIIDNKQANLEIYPGNSLPTYDEE